MTGHIPHECLNGDCAETKRYQDEWCLQCLVKFAKWWGRAW